MSRSLTKNEISELSIGERLRLIADLWDSIPAEQDPVPEWHRQALDEGLLEHERNPDSGRSWDEVRDELFPKK